MTEATDWYERRFELESGQIFKTDYDEIVKLDHPVPDDGSKWFVATWWNGSWAHLDSEIEPSDLLELLPEVPEEPGARP